jgi:hypothetical protein
LAWPWDPDELRVEVRATLRWWGQSLLADPAPMNNRWYQPFAVLSYCRMLHTLSSGRIHSKRASAQWARSALAPGWAGLIERALNERPNPSLKARQPADPADLAATLEFIRYAFVVSEANKAD